MKARLKSVPKTKKRVYETGWYASVAKGEEILPDEMAETNPSWFANYIKDHLVEVETDAIEKIRKIYFEVGLAFHQATKHHGVKEIGLKKWIKTIINPKTRKPYSYQHLNSCKRAYLVSDTFEKALLWYHDPRRTGDWAPKRMTGPSFVLELVKAFEDKNKPLTNTKPISRTKMLIAKVRTLTQALQEIAEEHIKLAEYADREPLVLNKWQHLLNDEDESILPLVPKKKRR